MATKGGLIVGPVSFDTNTFSKRLSDFVLLVEHHELVKRLDKIREYASHPQTADEQFTKRHEVAIGLIEVLDRKKFRKNLSSVIGTPELYGVYSFIGAVTTIMPWMTDLALRKLRGQILDGLDVNHDIRSLEHEMRCVVAFLNKGWSVELQDSEGKANFDFLARREGIELEVEAKTVQGDTGYAIKYLDGKSLALEVLSVLEAGKISRKPRIIRLSVSELPPRNQPERENYLKEFLKNVAAGGKSFDVGRISTEIETDSALLESLVLPVSSVDFMRVANELKKIEHGIVGANNTLNVPTYVVVKSTRESLLIKRTHESLRKAATQLSGTRPGLIWVHLHDLSEERLVQLNQKFEDGGITGVEEICILHFTNPSRSHVYGLAFSGDSKTVYAEGLGFREMRRSGNLLLRYNQNCKFDISLEQKDWFFGGA